eukprot:gene23352-30262_t
MPHQTAEEENDIHQCDILFLPHDKTYKYCLVVVDLATRKIDAEALKTKDAKTVMFALIKIYNRKTLKVPIVLQVDPGSEFKAGRHRSNAVVESVNKILGKIIFRFQSIEELHTGETNKEWVELLPDIVKSINKNYVRKPKVIDAYDIPIVSLCDTPGFMVGPEAEKTGLVRHVSRMFVTAASITVPYFTVVLRKGYGLGAQAMAGGGFHAQDFTISWPTGEFGGMGSHRRPSPG